MGRYRGDDLGVGKQQCRRVGQRLEGGSHVLGHLRQGFGAQGGASIGDELPLSDGDVRLDCSTHQRLGAPVAQGAHDDHELIDRVRGHAHAVMHLRDAHLRYRADTGEI